MLASAICIAALVLIAGCGGSSPRAVTTTAATQRAAGGTFAGGTRQGTHTTRPRRVDPGSLPQTDTRPAFGAALVRQMRTLWDAIAIASPRTGRDVFFPASAYRQLKAIPDPSADYIWRLRALFDLDIAAYHAHLGPRPRTAALVGIAADPALAEWIPPGVCENSIGYWHLPGTRLVYRVGGRRYSFGVFSLISWRGVWYVVHLGPYVRPSNVGTVDDPQAGPGVAGPGGGC